MKVMRQMLHIFASCVTIITTIAEHGTHDELIAKGGLYAAMQK